MIVHLFRICLAFILLLNHVIQGFAPAATHTHTHSTRRILVQPLLLAVSNNDNDNTSNASSDEEGIRLNKAFKATHSRREADDLIASGRVSVNGKPVDSKGGFKVIPFRDIIALDGNTIQGWERMNALVPPDRKRSSATGSGSATASATGTSTSTSTSSSAKQQQSQQQQSQSSSDNLQMDQFEYVKYFKPLGVTCTTDLRIRDNIIDSIEQDGYKPRHRVYPVGRLDKETSGLILLTSDGRVVNSVLRGEKKQPKVYKVMVDRKLDEYHLQRLRDGIVIKTVSQRRTRSLEENTLVAKTKPCKVERIGPNSCQMTLVEGRNRQIRKMMQALGLTVVRLHRIEFMGIYLEGRGGQGEGEGEGGQGESEGKGLERPGNWAYLDVNEMKLVENALRSAQLEDE